MCSHRRGRVVWPYGASGSQSNIVWKRCSSFPAEKTYTEKTDIRIDKLTYNKMLNVKKKIARQSKEV